MVPLYAVDDGIVVDCGFEGGWGGKANFCTVQHSRGGQLVTYCYMFAPTRLSVGDPVLGGGSTLIGFYTEPRALIRHVTIERD